MQNTTNTLSGRDLERIINNKSASIELADILFLKFSSDTGTILNLGRRGSLFAPEAILAIIKNFACHNLLKWSDVELADREDENIDFPASQNKLAQKIQKILMAASRTQNFVYLGGGHDYIYPTVSALNHFTKKMVVINLDAHLDTRTDINPNSGTPFRQIAEQFEGELEIIQLGIHDFANSISTMSNLPNGKEVVATYEDVRFGTKDFTETDKFLKRVIPYHKDTMYVFSLDADVLESGIMEGVSAVNHRGLPYNFVEDVLLYSIDELKCQHFGIFEYNPVYDNLSQKGARTLASLIYQIMDDRSFT
ncbi:MAG: arginase family protein [Bacteriovorax sp.]|nr:arginase family protein [Bacteriovorax sp.]